jgi:molybdopterin/thiamine biosynthesis adenylyltransferase
MMDLNDDQLLRYSRHILLNELGVEGQARICAAHMLVIGAGGLGSPAAMYLASAGVGMLTLVDHDTVDLTNLQRQILHREASVGVPKAESGRAQLAALNHEVKVVPVVARADKASLDAWVAAADVVLDCSDNFATRHAVNAACMRHGKPLVSAAAVKFDAQISVYDPRDAASPCYACLFAPGSGAEDALCAVMGVFAPLTGIMGTMQAAEALKLAAGMGSSLAGRLLMLDARSMEWTEVRIARKADCAVCAPHRNY